jgi:hypothetical protein
MNTEIMQTAPVITSSLVTGAAFGLARALGVVLQTTQQRTAQT